MSAAHPFLHLAFGLCAGALIGFKPLLQCWLDRRPLAGGFLRWYLWSYALAAVAIFPALLHQVGLPAKFCMGWWMNLFLFYPLLGNLKPGGMLVGELAIAAIFAMQYGTLLLAIAAIHHRKRSHHALSQAS